jgi:formylglycine-generating enzyme required for sulfatase activity/dienelactone hydrolase
MIGQTLSHYKILSKLGEGGMGEVYLAEDTRLDRQVALKVLPPEMASDPERLERFEREAKAVAALNHPNIVTIFSVEQAGDLQFIAMELVQGRTLTREISEGGMSPDRLLELAVPIADALAAAHRQGITHRDLKPDNIMIGEEGRLKILDFGLAKLGVATADADAPTALLEPTVTREGSLLGTVAYMSPEQAQGRTVDPRSDVFSLGIILYEMATGRRPFDGDNSISILSSVLRDTPTSISDLKPSAPVPLERIIRRCLEKDPERRYPDALEVRDDLESLRSDLISGISEAAVAGRPSGGTHARRARSGPILLGALVAVLLAVLGGWWLQRGSRARWARNEALPELERIVGEIQFLQEGPDSWKAYELASEIDQVIPDEPRLARLWPEFSREIRITSEPAGAAVFTKYYGEPDSEWKAVGYTPLEPVRYPLGFTRIKLELPGHRPAHDLIWNFGYIADEWGYELHPEESLPDEMEWVPSGAFMVHIPGLDHLETEPTAAFLIDRHEVTNAQFKEFLDAGGYESDQYWTESFVEDGREIPWREAIARFVDRTGRPGPATWEVGDHSEGRADYPVTGVSWYEAAAYATWAKKSLPTVFHWNRVAYTVASAQIIPLSNLAGEALLPVGATESMNRYGARDLAGNVREWIWNASNRSGNRFILGGGWNDPDYGFNDAYAQSAFDRSPTNGFRCIRYVEKEENLAALTRAIELPFRDFLAEDPVPDDVFELYLRQFTYDKSPLDPIIEEELEGPDYLRQKITFDAAYGGERMMAYLYLPRTGTPPYQAVVLFPGSGAIHRRSSDSISLGRGDFVVKSGRAVLYPIYKGTYERGGELDSDYPEETALYKDHVIMWGKDLSRSIDYLETREDIDTDRLAYYGLSWGGAMGGIMPAVEKRFKANVLYVAGMNFQRALPEVDQINYVPRVTQPTLMLNGELDFFFPTKTSQRPMFELLGTPEEHKKRLVYPGGHSVPRTEMIRETLAWLDRYLGPVE